MLKWISRFRAASKIMDIITAEIEKEAGTGTKKGFAASSGPDTAVDQMLADLLKQVRKESKG